MSCVAEPNDGDILVRFASFMFSRLSATDQCEKTDEIRQKLAEDILKAADGLPEGDTRQRTFTENLEADDQRELLNRLDPITPGNVQIPGTSDDDTKFRIDRFKQLPAGTPKIPIRQRDAVSIAKVSHRSFIRQQDFESAAQLLSRLSTFGFSLLSSCDRKRVADIGKLYGLQYNDDAEGEGEEEDRTIKSFTEKYNDASYDISDRVFLCTIISETFYDERRTREFIFYFRQLGTEDQEELIDELSNSLESHKLPDEDASDAIIEKFSEESEEDFRDRRFINLCVGYPFIWMSDYRKELNGAGKWDLRDLHETSRYTKFLNGISNIWAKARCPHDSRNLIQLIIDAIFHDDMEKLIPQGDDIEKLPNESMEDFRVRRFTESFNRLQISSQMHTVQFIQQTVFEDVGTALRRSTGGGYSTGDRSSYYNELIKCKPPNLRGGVVPPTSQGSEVVDHLALDFERSMG
ncbi:hypothetical protein M0R45_005779 [Rubus argutus]|uniref:Uncharacterized protein n=1 Tax=Rubus argutus TaxID=59490 RepID=A0AAW1YNS7_RUBAR